MTEEERQRFKTHKAAFIEALLRKMYGDGKAEAHLARIARHAEREREYRAGATSQTRPEEQPE